MLCGGPPTSTTVPWLPGRTKGERLRMKAQPARGEENSRATKNIGIRLPLDVIEAVKAEAKQRHIRVKDLFLEMWGSYRRQQPKK
jgi:hypothetical protein